MKQQAVIATHSKALVGSFNTMAQPKIKPLIHDTYELHYCVSGGQNYYIGNKIYDISPHDLFIIPPESVHLCTSIRNEKFERYVLFLHPKILMPSPDIKTDLSSKLIKYCNNISHKIHFSEEQHKHYIGLFKKFLTCEGYAQDISEYMAGMNILIYACSLIENNKQNSNDNNFINNDISTIISFIERNLADDLTLEKIAASLRMNERSISRKFKIEMNSTVYNYIINRRIIEAKKLLSENLMVTDVCELTGFNNYAHFCRTFNSLVGKSPKQYQTACLKE